MIMIIYQSCWKQQRTLITEQWITLKDSRRTKFVEYKFKSSKDERTAFNKANLKTVNRNLFLIWKARSSGWIKTFNMRVWSWLRMNAGGVLNTCKSSEAAELILRMIFSWLSGGRVSNAWVTCPIPGDNSWKRLLIPHKRTVPHGTVWKTPVVWDGPASD